LRTFIAAVSAVNGGKGGRDAMTGADFQVVQAGSLAGPFRLSMF
jgi:hypothetical protein